MSRKPARLSINLAKLLQIKQHKANAANERHNSEDGQLIEVARKGDDSKRGSLSTQGEVGIREKTGEQNSFAGASSNQGSAILDAKEIYRLKSTWKAVHRKIVDAGVELFLLYAKYIVSFF